MKGKENHGDIGEQWFINQMDGDRGSKTKTSNLQDGAPKRDVNVGWKKHEYYSFDIYQKIIYIYIYIIVISTINHSWGSYKATERELERGHHPVGVGDCL